MSEICHACSASYDYIYWVPDHVWEKIRPLDSGDGGLLCLQCVHSRSKEAGIVLRFSGSDNWWITDELTAARDEAEAFQKRMVELLTVCQVVQRDLLLRAEPDFDGSSVQVVNLSAGFWDELNRVIGKYDDTAAKSFDALILRKQAEAVEEMSGQPKRWEPGDLYIYAQRLRQQADEAEGGKHCTYPSCRCPFDRGSEFFCLRGLPEKPAPTKS